MLGGPQGQRIEFSPHDRDGFLSVRGYATAAGNDARHQAQRFT